MPQDWKDYFNDPALRAWIAAALANNRDLRVAALRIEEARALYGVQRADRLPSVDGTAATAAAARPIPARHAMRSASSTAPASASPPSSWTSSAGSRASPTRRWALLASAEAHRAAALSLVAETATAYFNERSLAEQQRLTRSTLELRETTLTLTQRRYDAGLETAMGLRTAQMLVESSRATLAELSREHSQAVHALGLLAGDFSLPPDADQTPLESQSLTPLAAGLPSALLTRRPDLRQAENTLKAANADIGAARAPFPVGAADHGHRQHRQQLLRPVRLGQRRLAIRAQADAADLQRRPQQRQPVAGRNPQAHRGGPVRRQHPDRLPRSGRRAVGARCAAPADRGPAQVRDADRERQRLAERRYARGVTNYLEMLDAQRSLFESEQEFIRLQQRRLVNAVTLYKALGGWEQGSGAS